MFTIVGRCPFHRGSRRFVRLREAAGLYPPASKPLPRQHGVGCGLQRDASQYSTLARSPSVAGAVATKSRGRRETLSSFSLDGGVCVITGGAQGLGLAMGRAVVQSGADLAIVDLNCEFPQGRGSCGDMDDHVLVLMSTAHAEDSSVWSMTVLIRYCMRGSDEEAKKQAGLLIDEYKLINKGEIDR